MFNNFYKIIHNKYSRLFEFIFFLRYLFIIFITSSALFLTIPVFFDYEKRAEAIKSNLLTKYNFKISNYEKIKYNIFPLPNLELTSVQIKLKFSENFSVKKIKIYPDIFSIYNYENFNLNKIILKDSDIKFEISNLKFFLKQLFFQKNKLFFDNLKLEIIDNKIPVVTLGNIKFTNFGYNKNLIRGLVFDKKFEVRIDDNFKNINFRLLNSGINADINFDRNKKNNSTLGSLKSKILSTNFKSNFEYDGKVIKIYNSYFRSKSLSLKNKIEIFLNPYLDINSEFIIEEFNNQIFRKVNLIEILGYKDFLKKINNKSVISFKSKKFSRNFFDDANLKINLAYGRMNYSKRLSFGSSVIKCDGNINFLEEYPLLFFNCIIKAENKREFLKKFSIKAKSKSEILELKVNGNLSILSRKVNFKNISMDESYEASKDDLKYFKDTFEKILFDNNFFEIFDLKKIKEFILEIS